MRNKLALLLGSALVLGLVVAPVLGQGGDRTLVALLTGFNEVSAVSTQASGVFLGLISEDELSIRYRLQFTGLEGTVTQAHIHLGQQHTNGGISVWLCDSSTNPSPAESTPECPTPGGMVVGTLTAAEVIGPAGQGIAPAEFAELLRALRGGATYANVHSSKFTGGEIRGQIASQ